VSKSWANESVDWHLILTPSQGIIDLPGLVSHTAVPLTVPRFLEHECAVAVIVADSFSDEDFRLMREACAFDNTITNKAGTDDQDENTIKMRDEKMMGTEINCKVRGSQIPWLRMDPEKGLPPDEFGEEGFVLGVMSRLKDTLGDLEAKGKLGRDGVYLF
jgi:hypothetical protein